MKEGRRREQGYNGSMSSFPRFTAEVLTQRRRGNRLDGASGAEAEGWL